MESVFGENAPTGSAFSQMRDRVSWAFFERTFSDSVIKFCNNVRTHFKGYYLNAVDGDQYLIERNKFTIAEGYKGHKCGKNLESYGLKMYVAIGIDMISGCPLAITMATMPNELKLGLETTKKIYELHTQKNYAIVSTQKHIFTYDRLYFCTEFIELHASLSTYFVVRCKLNGTFSEVKKFIESGKDEDIIFIKSIKIKLIKAQYNDTTFYYATNIFDDNLNNEDISWLYLRRWEVETTNSNIVNITNIEKFHSKKPNSMKQEIFASLWALLITKTNSTHIKQSTEDFRKQSYRRQNSKRVYTVLLQNLTDSFFHNSSSIFDKLCKIAAATTRKILRLSRKYARTRKYRRHKKYPYEKAVPIE